jgi:hypothetical protein
MIFINVEKHLKKDAKNIMIKPNVLMLLNQTLSNVIIVEVVEDYS